MLWVFLFFYLFLHSYKPWFVFCFAVSALLNILLWQCSVSGYVCEITSMKTDFRIAKKNVHDTNSLAVLFVNIFVSSTLFRLSLQLCWMLGIFLNYLKTDTSVKKTRRKWIFLLMNLNNQILFSIIWWNLCVHNRALHKHMNMIESVRFTFFIFLNSWTPEKVRTKFFSLQFIFHISLHLLKIKFSKLISIVLFAHNNK